MLPILNSSFIIYHLSFPPDWQTKSVLGMSVADINRTVRLAIEGLNIGTFKDASGDDYNINVTLPKGKTTTPVVFGAEVLIKHVLSQ